MDLIVQKYGGSSVADAEGIKRVAKRITENKRAGYGVVVVVSAMGDTTDDLLDLASQVAPLPPPRELDILLTAGERISMALLAMAISNLGFEARAFTGAQAGMKTDSKHGRARIIDVAPHRVRKALDDGAVAIVAGFQGVSKDQDVTNLGRGGSDTTAVALAAALNADVCEIYTDVDGVFTADPRIVPKAQQIEAITPEEMMEMAASGAKILHLRCVEYAGRQGVPLHVRSSFTNREGTWVTDNPEILSNKPGLIPRSHHHNLAHYPGDPGDLAGSQEETMTLEEPIISGVAHDRSEAKITVVGVPDVPGKAAEIFEVIALSEVNIDMIVQNVSQARTGLTDISFTLPMSDGQIAMSALDAVKPTIGFASLIYDDQIGKVSLVGAGMRSNPGVSSKFFHALSEAGVNVEMISTSEIRISIVTRADDVDDAVLALHSAFDLDSGAEEAVVHGGTGR